MVLVDVDVTICISLHCPSVYVARAPLHKFLRRSIMKTLSNDLVITCSRTIVGDANKCTYTVVVQYGHVKGSTEYRNKSIEYKHCIIIIKNNPIPEGLTLIHCCPKYTLTASFICWQTSLQVEMLETVDHFCGGLLPLKFILCLISSRSLFPMYSRSSLPRASSDFLH